MIDADGLGLKLMTRGSVGGPAHRFLPTGGRIAYYASHEGIYHIYVVRVDGKNLKRLTHDQGHVVSKDDFPLGAKIHLMTADGKYLKQLSIVREGIDYQPDFNPVRTSCVPHFQDSRNLEWVEETRDQPPIVCTIAF